MLPSRDLNLDYDTIPSNFTEIKFPSDEINLFRIAQ